MAFRRRRGAKKIRRATKRKGTKKIGRKSRSGGAKLQLAKDNYAKCSESSTAFGLNTNTLFHYEFNLADPQFRRAQLIAAEYQEFRIDYVEVKVKPFADTYQVGTFAAPQLYVQVIENGQVPQSISEMRHNGVNPTTLAKDGNKIFRFKPSVIYAGTTGGAGAIGTPSIMKKSPWLSTKNSPTTPGWTANTTVHYGMSMYADSLPQGIYEFASMEYEIHFSFRKPMYPYAPTTDPVVNVRDLVELVQRPFVAPV